MTKYGKILKALFELHEASFEAGRKNKNTPYEEMMSDSAEFDESIDMVYKLAQKITEND